MRNTEFNRLVFSLLQNSPERQKIIRGTVWGLHLLAHSPYLIRPWLFNALTHALFLSFVVVICFFVSVYFLVGVPGKCQNILFLLIKKDKSLSFSFVQQRLYSEKCDFYSLKQWDNVKKELDFAGTM